MTELGLATGRGVMGQAEGRGECGRWTQVSGGVPDVGLGRDWVGVTGGLEQRVYVKRLDMQIKPYHRGPQQWAVGRSGPEALSGRLIRVLKKTDFGEH